MASSYNNTIDMSMISNKLQNMGPRLSERRLAPAITPITSATTNGPAHVFYHNKSGDKVFLGPIADRNKLAHFSGKAYDQIISANWQPNNVDKLEIIIPQVDYDAGRIVLKYIEYNNPHNPRPLTPNLLPARAAFAVSCKVHHACNTLRINRQARGEYLRNHLVATVRDTRPLTFIDFRLACEWVFFDVGLMKIMLNKVAFQTLKGWVSQDELAKIWNYVVESDNNKRTTWIEQLNAIFAVLDKEEKEKAAAKRAAKEQENATFVHESVAPPPFVLSSPPEKAGTTAVIGGNSMAELEGSTSSASSGTGEEYASPSSSLKVPGSAFQDSCVWRSRALVRSYAQALARSPSVPRLPSQRLKEAVN